MRATILAVLLSACASAAIADPTPKEQLLKPIEGARHYTISSTAGKHGDIWSWTMPDGRIAYRMSMSLRGWITEDDQLTTLGPDGRPTAIAIRGYTDQGDATEDFNVDASGVAHWKTSVDSGSAPLGGKRYSTYGGPWLAADKDIEALVAAGDKGMDLLPSGHASLSIGQSVQIDGPQGPKTVKLAFIKGLGFAPSAVWLDGDNHYFGNAGTISLLPDPARVSQFGEDRFALAFARIECHYFKHRGFLGADDQLLAQATELKGIPGAIVHGRYDVATPLANAWDLHKVWQEAELTVVPDAGHTAVEPGIARALVAATQKFRNG